MQRSRILHLILIDGNERSISGGLVKLPSVSALVEAVHTEEFCIFGEGTAGKLVEETLEVCLGSVVILEPIVAERPVELHGVVLGGAADQHRHAFKHFGSLAVFAFVEVFECRFVFGINVVAGKQGVVLRLATCGKQDCRSNCGKKERKSHFFKYFSASIAARQPDAAAVMAWR